MLRNVSVIIAAGGRSVRMGAGLPKQYLQVEGLPVLVRTCKAFCCVRDCELIVVCPKDYLDYTDALLREYGVEAKLVCGGASRTESVRAGLNAAKGDYVLVHDGARPFVSEGLINGVLKALESGAPAAIPAVRPKSTIRTAEQTLERDSLYEVQTPQGFKADVLRAAMDSGLEATDEAGLAEKSGIKITITEGDYANIKITTKEDMPKLTRTGFGYDVHKLTEGRPLMLGCVQIPYDKGLLGHSDADVMAHAAADALLGAAALGDIGKIFPDNSAETEGMSGEAILSQTMRLVREAGFSLVNLDITLAAQRPKISPYTEDMRKAIAAALEVPVSLVSVKATTEEGLGITGSGEAMAAYAVCGIV